VDELNAKLHESHKVAASFQRELNERLRDEGAKLERTAHEAESLRETLRDHEQTIKGREEQTKHLTDSVTQLEAQLAAIKGELRDAQQELAECKHQLSQSKREHAEALQVGCRGTHPVWLRCRVARALQLALLRVSAFSTCRILMELPFGRRACERETHWPRRLRRTSFSLRLRSTQTELRLKSSQHISAKQRTTFGVLSSQRHQQCHNLRPGVMLSPRHECGV